MHILDLYTHFVTHCPLRLASKSRPKWTVRGQMYCSFIFGLSRTHIHTRDILLFVCIWDYSDESFDHKQLNCSDKQLPGAKYQILCSNHESLTRPF